MERHLFLAEDDRVLTRRLLVFVANMLWTVDISDDVNYECERHNASRIGHIVVILLELLNNRVDTEQAVLDIFVTTTLAEVERTIFVSLE